MPSILVASAIVPAFCEEAIRSSYIYYLSDRGSRRLAVVSIAAVFVIGEVAYDVSLLHDAIAELGAQTAIPLFILAILSGIILHVGLTAWTAWNQASGRAVWKVFGLALLIHGSFNVAAISAMERLQ